MRSSPSRTPKRTTQPPTKLERALKGVNVDIPKGKLTVVTGVSGSGKSSLVGDVLETEARRRYLESLSMYERQGLNEQAMKCYERLLAEHSGMHVARYLLGNLLFFWLSGPPLEDVWGRPVFAAFYLAAGIVGSLLWVVRALTLAALQGGQ